MTWGKIELLGDVQVQCLCPEHVLARLAETRCKTPIYLLTHLAELLKVLLCIFEATVCYTVLGHLLRVNFEAPFSALLMSDGTRRIVGCYWVFCVCMCAWCSKHNASLLPRLYAAHPAVLKTSFPLLVAGEKIFKILM